MSADNKPLQLAHQFAEHTLPDGRKVVLNWENDEGDLILTAPSGDLELQVRITPDGPVLQLSGARVELRATESVSIQTKTLDLNASERATIQSAQSVQLLSDGDTEVTAEGDVRVLGAMIHLN